MMNRVHSNSEELRGELDRLSKSALDSALNSVFNEIEKKLFIRAEHTANNDDKSVLFEKIAQLKSSRNDFENELYFVLTQSNPIPDKINWVTVVQNRSLALQMEDMVTNAKAKYGIEHAQYESRIKSLNQQNEKWFPKHLYIVSSITYAFIKASQLLPEDLRENLTRSLGSNLLYKLEPLYILLNDLLIQSGVLPDIKSKQASKQSELESLIDAISKSELLIEEELTEHTKISTEELKHYLKSSVEHRDIFLQSKSSWSPKNLIEEITQQYIKTQYNPKILVEINSHDQKIITLTGAILSDLINNHSINPVIKNQAITLQTIILHTAFTDSDFFSNLSHPARKVLSKLSALGADPYLSADDINNITNSVKAFIRSTTSENRPAFEQLSVALDALENDELLPIETARKDKSPSSLSITDRSRNRVTFIINSAIGSVSLCKEASAFLENVLNPYMVQALIRYGRQCDEWKEALVTLDAITGLESTHSIDIQDRLAVENKAKELIEHPFFGDEFLKTPATKTAADHYFSYLKDLGIQLATPQKQIKEERQTHHLTHEEHTNSTTATLQVTQPELEIEIKETSTPLAQTFDSTHEITAKQPDVRSAVGDEVKTDSIEPDGETKHSEPEPSPFEQLCSDPRIKDFLDHHVLNDEWLQIYTSDDAALRRLKASNINTALKTISFVNRNGETTLVLPLAQFIGDLFEDRSAHVFDNPSYNNAKQVLLETIKSEGLI